MRKLTLLASMLAMALMMAAPATVMADDFDGDGFEDFDEIGLFVVEIDDVDCDGFDDDFDGGIDEDVVCVVEFEIEDFDGFDSDGDGFDANFD